MILQKIKQKYKDQVVKRRKKKFLKETFNKRSKICLFASWKLIREKKKTDGFCQSLFSKRSTC